MTPRSTCGCDTLLGVGGCLPLGAAPSKRKSLLLRDPVAATLAHVVGRLVLLGLSVPAAGQLRSHWRHLLAGKAPILLSAGGLNPVTGANDKPYCLCKVNASPATCLQRARSHPHRAAGWCPCCCHAQSKPKSTGMPKLSCTGLWISQRVPQNPAVSNPALRGWSAGSGEGAGWGPDF